MNKNFIGVRNFFLCISLVNIIIEASFFRLSAQQNRVQEEGALLQEVTSIKSEIDTSYEREVGNENVSKVILFLGLPGAGKSAALNFIARKNLRVVQPAGNWRLRKILEVEDPVLRSEVRASAIAVTVTPGLWFDRNSKVLFCDCAGYCDPVDNNVLRNACILDYLMNKFAGKVVLTLVTSVDSLDINIARAQLFTCAAKNIAAFFNRQNAQIGSQSLSLLVTKTEQVEIDPMRIKSDIDEILLSLRQDAAFVSQNPAFFPLFESISNENIGFMPSPVRYPRLTDGMIFLDGAEGQRVRQALVAAVTRPNPLGNNFRIQVSLDNSGRAYALAFAHKVFEKLKTLMNNELQGTLVSNAKRIIASAIGMAAKRDNLRLLSEDLDACAANPVVAPANENFVKLDTDSKKEINQVRKHLQLLRFLASIAPEVGQINGVELVKKELLAVKAAINMLRSVPTHQVIGNDLYIIGFYTELSEVKNIVTTTQAAQNIFHIILYVWNTLYFDGGEVFFPGITLCVIAPHWKLTQSTKISLKGGDGQAGASPNASQPGTDGNSGTPGMNGGDFFGVCLPTSDLTGLRLDLSGGRGGDGSSGVNGKNGNPAPYANITISKGEDKRLTVRQLLAIGGNQFVEISLTRDGNKLRFTRVTQKEPARDLYSRSSAEKLLNTSFSYTECTHNRPAVTGEIGGNGGRGGTGGSGGKKGIFRMVGGSLNGLDAHDGVSATNGSGGSGGLGGKGSPSLIAKEWRNLAWRRKHSSKNTNWVQLTLSPGEHLWQIFTEDEGPSGKDGSKPTELVPPLQTPQKSSTLIFDGVRRNYFNRARSIESSFLQKFIEDLSVVCRENT